MGYKPNYRPLFLVCWLALALAGGGCDCARDKAPASDQVTATPSPFGRPQTHLPGWRGQPWLAGNELTTPTDVAIAADGTVYVAESWDTLSRIVERDGQWRARNVIDDPRTPLVEKRRLYSLVVDDQGALWGYNFTESALWKIGSDESGDSRFEHFRNDQLFSPFESVLAAGPDHSLLVGVNHPPTSDQARVEIFRFEPAAQTLTVVAELAEDLKGLARHPISGELYAVSGKRLLKIDPATGKSTALPLTLAYDISWNGLAFAPDGRLYLAVGDWSAKGEILCLDPQQKIPTLETFYVTPQSGLQGIAVGQANGPAYLYGVSRRGGDLYRIPLEQPDAQTDYRLIRGNGLSIAQNLAWAKNLTTGRAEILVNDGESGRLLRIDARDKTVRLLTETITYNHFGAKMSIDRNTDELLFCINAPGFENRFGLQRISPREPADVWPVLAKDAWASFRPASAVVARNGSTWITNLQERGEILELSADNQISLLVDAARVPLLRFPNGLAALDNGSLFVGVTQYNEHVYAGVPWSDTILMLTRERDIGWRCRTVFADKTHVDRAAINDFTVAPDGRVFIALRDKVYLAAPPYTNGVAEVLADGFGQVLGLTLDGDGNLYVADGENGSIWRFTPPANK
ncbi:MAG TPA: hypothetical protein PK961_14005 [bacterium]|nr:hypothetical protein [bacterium]